MEVKNLFLNTSPTFVTDLTRVFWLTFQYERFIKIVMGVIGEVINN